MRSCAAVSTVIGPEKVPHVNHGWPVTKSSVPEPASVPPKPWLGRLLLTSNSAPAAIVLVPVPSVVAPAPISSVPALMVVPPV